jgi:transposase-like protein
MRRENTVNLTEPDHAAVKRVIRPRLGIKAYKPAQHTIAGIALIDMLCNGLLEGGAEEGLTTIGPRTPPHD